MRYLFVGDPHATLDALDECRELIKLVITTAQESNVDVICFLGDLYHTHAVMRVEVMEFWHWAFDSIAMTGIPVHVLKGNHDMPNDGSTATALSAHKRQPGVKIINSPQVFEWDKRDECLFVKYVPYMANNAAFTDAAMDQYNYMEADVPVLICHQSFLGFAYENGSLIEDGVDFESLPYKHVVSGHIHAPQKRGRVWYPGAPRWRSASDVNTERHIHVVDFDKNGDMTIVMSVPTKEVCSEMVGLVDSPEKPLPDDLADCHEWNKLARVMIDIHGPQDWIERRKSRYSWAYRVRTFRTDNKSIRVKESEGIENAFTIYLEEYKPKRGTDKEILLKLVKERVYADR